MYKIGLSTTGEEICEETIKNYGDYGIEYIEISNTKENTDAINFDELKGWCDKYGVKIWSLHLPFYPFKEIDISSENLADYTVKYLCDLIKRASKVGINKFIIHPSGEPIEEAERKSRLETAKKSLNALCVFAKELGGTICVEDLPRSCLGRCSDDIIELLSANDDLRVCFDTNHLLGEDNCEFIRKVGSKIVTLHVSDYDFVNERHWLPGEGKNHWQGILEALKEINYNGIWLYEINMDIPKTIIRARRLTPNDFIKNANELFENKKLTVISTPKPNLGYWD